MSKQAATLDDRIADTFAGDETSQAIAALLQEVQQTSADAGVAYFARVMDAEIRGIEDEIEEMKRNHLADIARKDAEIAARNREIELLGAANGNEKNGYRELTT